MQPSAATLDVFEAHVSLLLVVVLFCSAIAVSAALLEEELEQQDNSNKSSSSSSSSFSGEPGTDVLITHGDRDEVVPRKHVHR
jgi:hypothetical protein